MVWNRLLILTQCLKEGEIVEVPLEPCVAQQLRFRSSTSCAPFERCHGMDRMLLKVKGCGQNRVVMKRYERICVHAAADIHGPKDFCRGCAAFLSLLYFALSCTGPRAPDEEAEAPSRTEMSTRLVLPVHCMVARSERSTEARGRRSRSCGATLSSLAYTSFADACIVSSHF